MRSTESMRRSERLDALVANWELAQVPAALGPVEPLQ